MMNKIPVGSGEPLKLFVEPIANLNWLISSQMEKWVTLSMDSFKAYMDLGVAQVKVALKIHDMRSLSEFADSQLAVWSFVGHRVLDDNRALKEWGVDYYHQANRLARYNLLNIIFK
ncbi:MAG: phasin family protein [Candidatus Competibacteraceae bacterium]|nr:phasin family protein [Candidatus Competibacteraceae bacterium]